MFSAEFTPIAFRSEEGGRVNKEFPPYNGFGSEEDSLCSCMGLLPKPPKRDFIKFMERDRRGLDSNVLRFLARMDTEKPIDKDRRFIISYFLSDDTILVFEPPVRNSGESEMCMSCHPVMTLEPFQGAFTRRGRQGH